MTTDRHTLVFRLFEAACELPPDQQRAFLDRECSGDSGLHAEVEDLLARDRGTAGLLDGRSRLIDTALLQLDFDDRRSRCGGRTNSELWRCHYRHRPDGRVEEQHLLHDPNRIRRRS